MEIEVCRCALAKHRVRIDQERPEGLCMSLHHRDGLAMTPAKLRSIPMRPEAVLFITTSAVADISMIALHHGVKLSRRMDLCDAQHWGRLRYQQKVLRTCSIPSEQGSLSVCFHHSSTPPLHLSTFLSPITDHDLTISDEKRCLLLRLRCD